MGWRNESVDALGRLEDATASLRAELSGSGDKYPRAPAVVLRAMRAARETFEAGAPALQEDRALFDELAGPLADVFARLLALLQALEHRVEGDAVKLPEKLRELAQDRATLLGAALGSPLVGLLPDGSGGKHVVTVSRQAEGVQLHLCPEVCAVDVQDGRILVCWPPESARIVARSLLAKAELPPPAKSDLHS